jgi:folate-binding protein YgfZ
MKIQNFDWHNSKGARFENFHGAEIPSDYGNIEPEYWALRNSVGIRDVSYFGKIDITGKDGKNFLHRMLSNDINVLQPGQGTWALFLNVKGHIQGDMKIYAFPDHLLVVLQHYIREKIVSGLDRYVIGENLQFHDATEEFVMFQIIGPGAESFLRSKGVQQLPETNLSFVSSKIGEVEVTLIRLAVGYAILGKSEDGLKLLNILDAQPVGMRAFEIFRVESGIPLMQRDVGETNFPQETRMDAAVSFQKGCYLGQETIARIDAQGHVNKFLTGIRSVSPIHDGDVLFKNGKEIGKITSSVQSIALNSPLALGYVRREFAKPGEAVEIGVEGAIGEVIQLPIQVG